METNTVLLSLNDYNKLREFKEKMEQGNTYKLHPFFQSNNYLYQPETTYITTDLALIEALETNQSLLELNKQLSQECNDLKQNHKNFEKVKNMSIWEFIKWRKNN